MFSAEMDRLFSLIGRQLSAIDLHGRIARISGWHDQAEAQIDIAQGSF
jgi:hypothetical protein